VVLFVQYVADLSGKWRTYKEYGENIARKKGKILKTKEEKYWLDI